MLKVLVCGSRDWTDRKKIYTRLSEFPSDTIIIQGGAEGADRIAKTVALDCGFHCIEVSALWGRYGKRAGPIRNSIMLTLEPELVIAFQKNNSHGTQDTIDKARQKGIHVEVYTDNDP